ncbi:MAG: hypothetical protein WC533_04640 [Candidatus Pacearchaeota archaeon]
MAEEIIKHPCISGFPFIKLSEIQEGRKMSSGLRDEVEVIACSPVEVRGGLILMFFLKKMTGYLFAL